MATPRSSYRLPPDLKLRVRARAKAEGVSDTDFVVRALEAELDRPVSSRAAKKAAADRNPESVREGESFAASTIPGSKTFRGPFPKEKTR